MNDQENQLIREMTTDLGEPEPVDPNDSNETGQAPTVDPKIFDQAHGLRQIETPWSKATGSPTYTAKQYRDAQRNKAEKVFKAVKTSNQQGKP